MVQALGDLGWRTTAVDAIANRPAWFELLRKIQLPVLMTEVPEHMVRVLTYALAFSMDEVLTLIERHWLPDRAKHDLGGRVLQSTRLWPSRARDLVLALVRSGLPPHLVDYLAQAAVKGAPDFAPDSSPRSSFVRAI